VPIREKRENFLQREDKKARLSATMAIVLCTSSSYRLDAKASRGRARFFVARRARIRDGDPHHPFHDHRLVSCHMFPPSPLSTHRKPSTRYLKKEADYSSSKQWVTFTE
jgi:hypothetical protein